MVRLCMHQTLLSQTIHCTALNRIKDMRILQWKPSTDRAATSLHASTVLSQTIALNRISDISRLHAGRRGSCVRCVPCTKEMRIKC